MLMEFFSYIFTDFSTVFLIKVAFAFLKPSGGRASGTARVDGACHAGAQRLRPASTDLQASRSPMLIRCGTTPAQAVAAPFCGGAHRRGVRKVARAQVV